VSYFPQQPLPAPALTAADRELCFWTSDGVVHDQNVGDFLAGVPLGVRERPPEPLSSYYCACTASIAVGRRS
jgi:hypothetical protein